MQMQQELSDLLNRNVDLVSRNAIEKAITGSEEKIFLILLSLFMLRYQEALIDYIKPLILKKSDD
jgi:hypothetical protein